ncbi:hypothetical protein ACHHYP_03914 [Achlya hypogyna]|uniref:Uncharacterized protein n=1 Tax=Achlya hypogyna TaxID=1202772 RepID=A0A1V9Z2K3_ACHHY|nr:hypothetical protein ACHHYP_03914 [Achlya hypogyna]
MLVHDEPLRAPLLLEGEPRHEDILLLFCNYVLDQEARPKKRARTEVVSPCRRAKRRVMFTTMTTYEFDAEVNGSAVPSERGPPIGLARSHIRHMTNGIPEDIPGKSVRKLPVHERIARLQMCKYSHDDIASFARDAAATRDDRRLTRDELRRPGARE